MTIGVAVHWFFEGFEPESPVTYVSPRQRPCLELARNFAAIDNSSRQEAWSQLARAPATQDVTKA